MTINGRVSGTFSPASVAACDNSEKAKRNPYIEGKFLTALFKNEVPEYQDDDTKDQVDKNNGVPFYCHTILTIEIIYLYIVAICY